eukprot:2584730-Prymnesium_polylepis.1
MDASTGASSTETTSMVIVAAVEDVPLEHKHNRRAEIQHSVAVADESAAAADSVAAGVHLIEVATPPGCPCDNCRDIRSSVWGSPDEHDHRRPVFPRTGNKLCLIALEVATRPAARRRKWHNLRRCFGNQVHRTIARKPSRHRHEVERCALCRACIWRGPEGDDRPALHGSACRKHLGPHEQLAVGRQAGDQEIGCRDDQGHICVSAWKVCADDRSTSDGAVIHGEVGCCPRWSGVRMCCGADVRVEEASSLWTSPELERWRRCCACARCSIACTLVKGVPEDGLREDRRASEGAVVGSNLLRVESSRPQLQLVDRTTKALGWIVSRWIDRVNPHSKKHAGGRNVADVVTRLDAGSVREKLAVQKRPEGPPRVPRHRHVLPFAERVKVKLRVARHFVRPRKSDLHQVSSSIRPVEGLKIIGLRGGCHGEGKHAIRGANQSDCAAPKRH